MSFSITHFACLVAAYSGSPPSQGDILRFADFSKHFVELIIDVSEIALNENTKYGSVSSKFWVQRNRADSLNLHGILTQIRFYTVEDPTILEHSLQIFLKILDVHI
jgi:hypothetical protein